MAQRKTIVQKYVIGFLFNEDCDRVALIYKQKPDWQRNHWNGIGGKIEKGEPPIMAMQREFLEETGVEIRTWRKFCILSGERFELHCFTMQSDRIKECKTLTDEKVDTFDIDYLFDIPHIPNIEWLIRMALSFDKGERCEMFRVREID